MYNMKLSNISVKPMQKKQDRQRKTLNLLGLLHIMKITHYVGFGTPEAEENIFLTSPAPSHSILMTMPGFFM